MSIAKFIRNLKLYTKLMLSIGIILILFISLITVNIFSLYQINSDYTYLLNYPVERRTLLRDSMHSYANVRRLLLLALINQYNPEKMPSIKEEAYEEFNTVCNNITNYKNLLHADPKYDEARISELANQAQNVLELMDNPDTGYKSIIDSVTAAIENGMHDQTDGYLEAGGVITKAFEAQSWALIEAADKVVSDMQRSLAAEASKIMKIIITLSVLTAIISIIYIIIIANSLSKRLGTVTNSANKLAAGKFGVSNTTNDKDEIGELGRAMDDMQQSVQQIIDDVNEMHEEQGKGDIEYFLDPTKYKGAYAQLVGNINDSVKSQIEMSKNALNCVMEIGDGNFDAQIERYPGKKVFINDAIEELRGNIKNVNREVRALIQASTEGKLSARADAQAFKGDWNKLIDSLNSLCDAIVDPVMEALNVLQEITKGNMRVKVTGSYQGDFKEMKDAFNFMTSELSEYINEIGTVLQEIANANLNIEMKGDFVGDFSAIKSAIIAVDDRLNAMVSNINNVTEQVSEGAKNISQSGIMLANGASEQAGAVQQLSATVETVSQKTKANSDNADAANRMSKDSMRSAQESTKEMQSMLESMEGIKESSNKISQIIKTIEDIAFQTNLLALNAAVEAARAGENGKGFAIVAEEVRSLAAHSQDAAKETNLLIEDSIKRVNEGASIAKMTAESLDEIVGHVTKISNLISIISDSSKDQAEAVSRINSGLSQISNVATSNAATSEQSSAASDELSNQAESLYKLISTFTLKNDHSAYSRESA